MRQRRTLLVGSLPADNAEQAMTEAMREVGPYLLSLPDGEVGTRSDWIRGMVASFQSHPNLVPRRPVSDHVQARCRGKYVVRAGHRLAADGFELGLYQTYLDSRSTMCRLREDYQRPDLAFQIGLPSSFGLAQTTLGRADGLRHQQMFTEVISREIDRIYAEAGDGVLFQLEVPPELIVVNRAPAALRAPVAAWFARWIRKLVARGPAGVRFGIHLCLGDFQHKVNATMVDTTPLVLLANAIARAWPANRLLEYLHAPLAAGQYPPPKELAFYRPLAGLRLPGLTRFVAGFLHEDHTFGQARRTLGQIESCYGQPVDVAAACGLGRRGHEHALTLLRQASQLCADA